jgi:hypothetical protein
MEVEDVGLPARIATAQQWVQSIWSDWFPCNPQDLL